GYMNCIVAPETIARKFPRSAVEGRCPMVTLNLRVPKVERVADVMQRAGVTVSQLVSCSGLDGRIVLAIVNQRYVASPVERRRVAAVLNVDRKQLWWGHQVQVERLSGPC